MTDSKEYWAMRKALAACRESAAATKEIKRLSNVIGDSLSACNVAFIQLHGDFTQTVWRLHIERAYEFEVIEETQYTSGVRDYKTPEEQMEILAECSHCLAAHNAIQDRKKAKKRLANARRAITIIGRSA